MVKTYKFFINFPQTLDVDNLEFLLDNIDKHSKTIIGNKIPLYPYHHINGECRVQCHGGSITIATSL